MPKYNDYYFNIHNENTKLISFLEQTRIWRKDIVRQMNEAKDEINENVDAAETAVIAKAEEVKTEVNAKTDSAKIEVVNKVESSKNEIISNDNSNKTSIIDAIRSYLHIK